ncbi:MAG: hypothetical protein AAF224_09945 [Pseudomonadota bacterium]
MARSASITVARAKIVFSVVALALLPCAASAVDALPADSATCRKGADERLVRVRAPGVVGAACDVSYVQDYGAWETIPFHANADVAACRVEAMRLIENLTDGGFVCSGALTVSSDQKATTQAVNNTDAPVVSESSSDDSTSNAVNDMKEADGGAYGDADTPSTETEMDAEQAPALTAPALRIGSNASSRTQLKTLNDGVGVASSATPARFWRATTAPVDLTASAMPLQVAVPVQRRAKAAGRLMGAAAPTAPAVGSDVAGVLASLEILDPAGVQDAETAPLKAALSAQAAAWTRGDMDAFYRGFVTREATTPEGASAAVSFGDDLRAGFEPFAELYVDRTPSGALQIAVADIEMVSPAEARVAGAVSLDRADASGSKAGAQDFLVVMRKVGAAWRIVRP